MEKDEVFFLSILAFITGIALGSFFALTLAPLLLLGGAFFWGAGIVFRSWNTFFFGCFVLVLLGGAWLSSQARERYSQLPALTDPVSGTARIVADPQEKDFFRNTVLRFEDCTSVACPETDILWQAPLSFAGEAGTKLMFQCQLELPQNFTPDFDYRMFLRKDGVGYVCPKASKAQLLPPDRESFVRAALYAPKHVFEEVLSQVLQEPEAGLAKGLLLGGDNYLPRDLKDSFTRVGLSHMIAVSGYNITLIAQMLLALGLLLGLWRKQSIWFALIGIVFFIFMIGVPASAARAGTMAGIVFLALQSGRLARPVNALLFAGAVMLLLNPLLLRYDLGFQLSFLATLGILLLMPYYERFAPEQVVLKKGGEILFMTLAVELFVLPLILFSFHAFSPLIIIGNFLVVLVPFAMVTSFLAGVAFLLIPGVHVVVAWAALALLMLLTRSVEVLGAFTQVMVTVDSFGVWHLVWWYAILGVLLWIGEKYFPLTYYDHEEKF